MLCLEQRMKNHMHPNSSIFLINLLSVQIQDICQQSMVPFGKLEDGNSIEGEKSHLVSN